MVRRTLLLLLALPVLLLAAPAHAEGEVSSLPDGTYTYDGTYRTVQDPGSDTPDSTGTTEAGITCSAGRCTVDKFAGGTLAVAPDGSFSQKLPDTYRCSFDGPQDGRGAISVTGQVTATSLTYRYEQKTARSSTATGSCTFFGFTSTFSGSRTQSAAELAAIAAAAEATATPAPDPDAGPSGTDSTGDRAGSAGSVSRLDSGEADAPSVLSATPRAQDLELRNALVGAVLAVILVILVAFPTTLLNSATQQGADRFSRWWRQARGAEDEPPARRRWWWAASGVLLAGVISAFVDPNLGFNPGSFRALASLLIAFGLETVVGWAVVVLVMRRVQGDAEPSYSFRPATLVVVALAVLLARVTEFEPGIVFGLVAGVAFPAVASKQGVARSTLVTVGWAYLLALVAWGAYSAIGPVTSAGAVFGVETLAAIAVTGMAALPIALIPVRGMPGRDLFDADRRLWFGAYAVGLIGFLVVLMPMPSSWDEVDWSIKGWVIAYLVYLGAALTAWLIVRRGAEEPVAAE